MDRQTLEMALVGYEQQKAQVEVAIQNIKKQLRMEEQPSLILVRKPVHRAMSSAAKKRISAAQKKRWALFRRTKAS